MNNLIKLGNMLLSRWMIVALMTVGPVFCPSALAQQFGGNPASVRWMQINTDTVRLIFPKEWKGNADRLAELASTIAATSRDLGRRARKIDIVLQHQTTYSNAYVGLGPRRSEFFLTPPQNSFELGSLQWTEQLMLHEYRHVQQYDNFYKGLSRLFYILSGELGFGLVANAAVPNWFWEGDAVVQETLLSEQGRGRLPYFHNGYRSLWSSGKRYSWLKLRNGSLRDYVPNHYQLGYLLTAYAREKWGDTIWRKVTSDALRFKGLAYPFQKAVKRNLNMSYAQFRQSAFAYFSDSLPAPKDHYSSFAARSRHFAGDEEYPFFVDTGKVLFIKSSYSRLSSFCIRDLRTGSDRWVRNRDIALDNYYSFRNGKVVYAALGFDPRWDWRNYGELRVLDLATGQQRSVTRKTHYFSPDIDSTGEHIVAVSVAPDGTNSLHLIDARSGEVLLVMDNSEGYFYTCPKFIGANAVIAPVRNSKGQMALLRVNWITGKKELLLQFSYNVIGYPNIDGGDILVTVSYGQQDKLVKVGPSGAYIFRPVHANTATGSYALSTFKGRMAWTSYTAAGYRMDWQDERPDSWVPLSAQAIQPELSVFGMPFLGRQQGLPGPSGKIYNRAAYPKTKGLVRFHSWIPDINEPDYSLLFLTDNILNTLSGYVELNYNTNEQSRKLGVGAVYGGWYPLLRMSAARTFDRSQYVRNNKVYWNETEWRAGVSLPLNLSGGRHYAFLNTGLDYVQVDPDFKGRYKDSFNNNPYGYAQYAFSLGRQVQQARQHIFPRWAQEFRLTYKKAVTRLDGHQLNMNLQLYLPGLFNNNHLVLQAAFQQRDTLRRIAFSNAFPFSRGYVEPNFRQMFKWGASYHFPLAYPDRGFGSIVYFLRVRASLFYDHTRVSDFSKAAISYFRVYRSAGAECYFDTKWWNQHPVSFGFRYSRLLDSPTQPMARNQWTFVLPVNLIGR